MIYCLCTSSDSLRRASEAAIEQAKQAFPNISVSLQSDGVSPSLVSRRTQSHGISHLLMPRIVVDASGPKAIRAGFGDRLKLLWQFKGTMRYEDANGSFELGPGGALITAMGRNYRIETSYDYEGLALIFDPASSRSWQDIAYQELGKPISPSGPLAAAAAGTLALLRHHSDSPNDVRALDSLVDIALRSLDAEVASSRSDQPLSPILARARLLIAQHISEQDFGPDQLARGLGLSRRSLYNAFDRTGLTPATLIRRVRLERARGELLDNPDVSITTIALSNGFPDSSSFSHAFRASYGLSPRDLRNLKKLP